MKKYKPVVPRKILEKKASKMVEAVISEKKGKHMQEKLNAHDLMFLAKHMPGEFDAPYVLGGDISTLHTTTVKTTFTATKSYYYDATLERDSSADLGTNTFVVIYYIPQASLFHVKSVEAYKAGGLFI